MFKQRLVGLVFGIPATDRHWLGEMPGHDSKFGFHIPPRRLHALCGELVHNDKPETHVIPTDVQAEAVVGVSDTVQEFEVAFQVPPKVVQALGGGFGTVMTPGVPHDGVPDQVPPITVQASWFVGNVEVPIPVQAPVLVVHVPFND